MSTIKYGFMGNGAPVTASEFEKMHFKQLLPAEAGRCMMDMKYQTLNAFCDHGIYIECDPNICKTELDDFHKEAFRNLCYIGAYYLEIEEELEGDRGIYRCNVFFILIPSNSNRIFAFYDVQCA